MQIRDIYLNTKRTVLQSQKQTALRDKSSITSDTNTSLKKENSLLSETNASSRLERKKIDNQLFRNKVIEKISKANILFASFLIYTVGDLIGLFINNHENKKRNPEQAYSLLCQNISFVICNLLIYWGAVFGIKRFTNSFASKFVEGYEPKEVGRRASERISDILGILGGLPFNDVVKPIFVSMITNKLINKPNQTICNIFGFQLSNLPTNSVQSNF